MDRAMTIEDNIEFISNQIKSFDLLKDNSDQLIEKKESELTDGLSRRFRDRRFYSIKPRLRPRGNEIGETCRDLACTQLVGRWIPFAWFAWLAIKNSDQAECKGTK
jgi:hypothetical protein